MEFNMLSVVQLIGGLALFIYGMTTMGKGLERAAGSKLEKTLEKMTGNVFKALLMGLVVTMVIQSSSATTVMVVGFVNAGIMSLRQSVGVILGANIGTTITAQILRLDNGTGSGNLLMDMLKPSNLAYIVVLAGVIIMMLAKKRRTRDIADIFTGFGILFIGMSVMEGSVAPLADLPQFAELFAAISNPVLGVLDRFLWLQFDELRILPDFGSGQPTVEDRVSCRVSAQALFIVLAAVRVLYEFWRKKVLDIFL